MHDLSTVAFEIHYPWHKRFWQTSRQYLMDKNYKYHDPFITIWHEDPETDGSDDSCGYSFPKVPKILIEEVKKEAALECSDCGLFPNYNPKYDPTTIILGIFQIVAWRLFKRNITPKQLVEMISVCVNPVDNLRHCTITNNREDVERLFYLCLRCYLRITRPWYRHPRWQIHHWKFQIHPLQKLKRFLFKKCEICKKGFGWNESVMGNWGGNEIYHHKCYDDKCVVKR